MLIGRGSFAVHIFATAAGGVAAAVAARQALPAREIVDRHLLQPRGSVSRH
jgi:hypothetical protein